MINALLLSTALATTQTHTPSVAVQGDIVTVDADIAMVVDSGPATVAGELISGVPLLSAAGTFAASDDGVSPIVWKLPPGEYLITAYGFPEDRLNPIRNVVTLTANVSTPDRGQQIAEALQQLTLALFDAGKARQELDTLNPTRQELIDALSRE